MKERLLHYIWQHKLYHAAELETTTHQAIHVIHPGYPHQDAGPDFKQAIISIGDMTWAGNVEIHLKTSDWLQHGHQHDPKYQNIILHIVYSHDMEISKNEQAAFPTLELKDYIPKEILTAYQQLSLSDNLLPCRQQIPEITPLTFTSFISSFAMERLFQKQQNILEMVEACKGNWEEAFFRLLAINFGFKTNTTAFELLGKHLPYRYIAKHAHVQLQVYALIFGQAGMLENEEPEDDDYYAKLQKEYQYLRYKYKLTPIHEKNWNRLRLRPANFPAIRLAQFSELLHHEPDLFKQLISSSPPFLFDSIFSHKPHDYWENHFMFNKSTKSHSITLGKKAIELIVINTIAPFLFAYAHFHGNETLQMHSINLLEETAFEENKTTLFYRDAGFPSKDALCSQAILEIANNFCKKKKCLACAIGSFILKRSIDR